MPEPVTVVALPTVAPSHRPPPWCRLSTSGWNFGSAEREIRRDRRTGRPAAATVNGRWTRRNFLTTAVAAMPMATVARTASSSTSPSAPGSADLRLTLPAPTGPHRLGIQTLHLIQTGRPDPWNGSPDRELMLTVFYPALTIRGFPLAPQMTSKAAQKFSEIDAAFLHPLPKSGVDWSATLIHSHLNAPASRYAAPSSFAHQAAPTPEPSVPASPRNSRVTVISSSRSTSRVRPARSSSRTGGSGRSRCHRPHPPTRCCPA